MHTLLHFCTTYQQDEKQKNIGNINKNTLHIIALLKDCVGEKLFNNSKQ